MPGALAAAGALIKYLDVRVHIIEHGCHGSDGRGGSCCRTRRTSRAIALCGLISPSTCVWMRRPCAPSISYRRPATVRHRICLYVCMRVC
jgi:hypothetical protein